MAAVKVQMMVDADLRMTRDGTVTGNLNVRSDVATFKSQKHYG
jgi:hypothetical protein